MKLTQNPYHSVIPLFMADQTDRLIGLAIMCSNCRKAHPVSTEQDALFRIIKAQSIKEKSDDWRNIFPTVGASLLR